MSPLPPPRRSPPNGLAPEQASGVFKVKTGHTRRTAVKWGALCALLTALFTPIAKAIADRISPPPEKAAAVELRELLEHIRDAGL